MTAAGEGATIGLTPMYPLIQALYEQRWITDGPLFPRGGLPNRPRAPRVNPSDPVAATVTTMDGEPADAAALAARVALTRRPAILFTARGLLECAFDVLASQADSASMLPRPVSDLFAELPLFISVSRIGRAIEADVDVVVRRYRAPCVVVENCTTLHQEARDTLTNCAATPDTTLVMFRPQTEP
jgi:hypothetical protein